MFLRFGTLASVCAGLLLCAAAPPAGMGTGTLTVEVDNVRAAKGRVRLDVCPEGQFLKENCPHSASVAARPGLTQVVVTGLAPGRYAVQAFLDENNNSKVDRNFLGLPTEGVGFSNDAKIRFGPPKFADAAFAFPGGQQTIRLKLRYFP